VNSSQTGTITVKSGSQTISNPVSISIGQPVATITSTSPKQLPQVIPAGATRTIAIQGGSFVQGMNVRFVGPSGPTVPYNCTTFATVTTDAWCLQSSTQFFLKLSSAALLGAAANGSQITVYLSAGIPAANGSPPVPGQTTIQVVTTPIVSAVTDAASFMQPVPGQPLNVAPYEMLSIFGDNFGTPGANTGVGFNQGRLLSQLTDTTGNALNVHFTDGSGSALPADSDGFLLLWTPTQINVLAPSAVIEGQQLKATVSSGGFTSTPDPISTFTVAKANPGLLTIGGTQAVAVNVDNSINSSTNPARFGQTIVLYLSGMGAPRDGTAVPGPANAGPLGSGLAACADLGLFQAAATLQHSSWLTIDGAVIDNAILGPYAIAPCFDPATVSVKLGNLTPQAGWVAYAGFTEDSIAGLYQVNIAIPLSTALSTLLPAAAATATAYPIQVSINGAISQAGVNVYLAK
jgi:uncharacterized protein (TIGR03437 family)